MLWDPLCITVHGAASILLFLYVESTLVYGCNLLCAALQPLKQEWVIVLDNSGSMVQHERSVCETVALIIEFLRKLECQFAVVRVGAESLGSQKVKKHFHASPYACMTLALTAQAHHFPIPLCTCLSSGRS